MLNLSHYIPYKQIIILLSLQLLLFKIGSNGFVGGGGNEGELSSHNNQPMHQQQQHNSFYGWGNISGIENNFSKIVFILVHVLF